MGSVYWYRAGGAIRRVPADASQGRRRDAVLTACGCFDGPLSWMCKCSFGSAGKGRRGVTHECIPLSARPLTSHSRQRQMGRLQGKAFFRKDAGGRPRAKGRLCALAAPTVARGQLKLQENHCSMFDRHVKTITATVGVHLVGDLILQSWRLQLFFYGTAVPWGRKTLPSGHGSCMKILLQFLFAYLAKSASQRSRNGAQANQSHE